MSEEVTIDVELNHGGSSGISQLTLGDAAGVDDAGGNAVLPGGAQPAHCFMEDYYWTSLESEAGTDTAPDSDAGRLLFRRVGEKQYLWSILEIENPWGFCKNKQRRASWDRAARKVLKPGLVDITDEKGKRTVEVDVSQDRHIPLDVVTRKIKRLWLASRKKFRDEGTFAKTGESIAERRTEGEESEMLHLEKAVRLSEVSFATRHLKPHALAAAYQAAGLVPPAGGCSAGPGESGSDRTGMPDGSGGGGDERGDGNSSPGATNHVHSEGLRALEEEADVLEEKEDPPPVDEASVVEGRGECAQSLAGVTLGTQVTQGAGERKRKFPNAFEEGMSASSILGVVSERLIDKMDNGAAAAAARVAAVQQQVNQRLDLMAAEQKRVLDGIVAQQNVMSGQLSALLTVFSQTALAGAAAAATPPPPPPFAYGPPHPHAAHMAGLPWPGVYPGFLPPGAAMGFGGFVGPHRGMSGVAPGVQASGVAPGVQASGVAPGVQTSGVAPGVQAGGVAPGVQASGPQLPGFGNAGAPVGVAGVASVARQQQQGGPVGGGGGAAGLQAGGAPDPATGATEVRRVSQVLQDSRGRTGPVEGAEKMEEEETVGVEIGPGGGEGGPCAPATTKSAC